MLSVLDGLAAELRDATILENWKHRLGTQTELRLKFNAPDLTVRQQGAFQVISLEGKEITIGAMATDDEIAAEIAKIRGMQVPAESIITRAYLASEKVSMGLADRLKEKALRARAVTSNAVKELEAGMDEIIAEEAALGAKKEQALAAHREALGTVKGEWDGLKSAVDILSNGAPE